MRFEKKFGIVLITALAALVLAGCFSLAGDITPPPNYIAPTELPTNPAGGQVAMGASADTTQPASQQTVFPLVPPDPVQGAALYAEHCSPCHGDTGKGDGTQGAQLPNQPPAIGTANLARTARPVDWYNTITQGNMKQFMPPFAQALNDRQRWDVLAYVYTLSGSADAQQGKALYEQNCADCHGANGLGDGTKAASLSTRPVSWVKDQSRLASLSADDIVKVVDSGKGEMPAYQGKLNAAQSYQVAAYVRSLSFSSQTPAEAAAAGTPIATPASGTPAATSAAGTPVSGTPGATTAAGAATITGSVTNGTPGGKVPGGLKASLSVYSGMSLASTLDTDVAADGTYAFKDVAVDPNNVYIVSVAANGVTFNSDILHGTDIKGATAALPLKIYEPSTDASKLTVDRLHVFFDFSTANVVQVVNLYVISNPSDHVIVQSAKDMPVVSFDLPKGATNLKFQDGALGGRYLQTANGFGDTMGIPPGTSSQQILFAYDMPYTSKLDMAVQSPLPVTAAIVMVPPGVKLTGGQLTDAGQQDVQGTSFHMFQSNTSLKAGEALNLSLSGMPSTTSGTTSAATQQGSVNYLLVGLGAFGLVLVAVGVWLYLSQSRRAPALVEGDEGGLESVAGDGVADGGEESSEALLDAIVALDDLHASGNLPDAAYHERRDALKARLGDALAREKGK